MKHERKSGVVELSKALNLSNQTIGKYSKQGMPHDEEYKGFKLVRRFNIEECKSWVREQRGK